MMMLELDGCLLKSTVIVPALALVSAAHRVADWRATAPPGVLPADALAADDGGRTVSTAHPSLDVQLPGGGWPLGALIELLQPAPDAPVWPLVLPALVPLLQPGGALLMLVKPQFELQPGQVGKGGLVKDAALHAVVEQRIRAACAALGLQVRRWLDSPISGGDGNREFFVYATR